jgi:tellurite resistance protein TerB
MFNFFRQKGQEIADTAVRAENKKLMEAMVGAACLVAYADGELSDEEVTATSQLLTHTPALKAFGDTPAKEFDRLCNIMEAGYRMGKLQTMRDITKSKDNKEDAEMVLVIAIEVAYADGGCEPDEEKVLEEIANKLGLKLQDYI